jgi:signal transduction histidine kinase
LGNLNLLSSVRQSSFRGTGIAKSALRAISTRLAQCLAGLRHKAALNRLGIPGRLILLVLALAVPLNLIIAGVVWGLVKRANDAQRTSLLYAARSIAAGVDAELGKYVALGEALSRSPALLDDNLDAFEAEARRAFPTGGVVVSDVDGQQLLNTFARSEQALPRRNPAASAAQRRALSTRSIVITDLMRGALTQDWGATIELPIFKGDQPFRGLAVIMREGDFLRLLSAADVPRNWLTGIIDGEGRYIARVPQGSAQIGQFASEGWRAIKDQTGIFEHSSLEGEAIITAKAHPSMSNWTVGVAIKKRDVQATVWDTVRWAVMLGAVLSAASLLLAWGLARQITRPINQLRQLFAGISAEPGQPIKIGPPEILELQDTLRRTALERATAVSKLEREMTLREEAQIALAQAQRLEALGQLAGGMAHDSNNVLAAISANLDTVRLGSSDEKRREAIEDAMDAIQMGASLNRRLLFLSRPQGVGLERLDLNDRVTGTLELLKRTLGEQVTVSLRLSLDPCQTSANPGDVDTAILNLAINARDAMPKGGTLTLETRQVTIDADAAGRIPEARPGEYVTLTVSDTGHGMSPEILKHAMEPFFTTKGPGKGTGLGLATVYGTVRQSGGFIRIDSTVGKGTSVHLHFPKAEPGPIVNSARLATKEVPLGDGELILVVEDNDTVRKAVTSRLESLGYAVLDAKTGPEAITMLQSGAPIALVFSDIVMPGGMTGYDVAEWVRSTRPGLKVVLTSGYSDAPLAASESVRAITVLGKPYTREQLAYALREALDG